MPTYLYECKPCGVVFEFEMGMMEDKPERAQLKGGKHPAGPFNEDSVDGWCYRPLTRKFTLPGMSVKYVEEWVVRNPGEVGRERRDMAWRRKHGKGYDDE